MSSISALEATPIRVPNVSNRSTNRTRILLPENLRNAIFEKSSFIKVWSHALDAKSLRKNREHAVRIPALDSAEYRPVSWQIITECPCDQDTPENVAPYIFYYQNTSDQILRSWRRTTVIPSEEKVPAAHSALKGI